MANRSATRATFTKRNITTELHIRAPLLWLEKSDLWFKQLDIRSEANKVTSDQPKFLFTLPHFTVRKTRRPLL